jgi:DNA-directed RNA polymerase subunit RPC12/RpoP
MAFEKIFESINTCEICGHHQNDGMWIRKTDMKKFHYVCLECVEKFFDNEIPTIVKKDSQNIYNE